MSTESGNATHDEAEIFVVRKDLIHVAYQCHALQHDRRPGFALEYETLRAALEGATSQLAQCISVLAGHDNTRPEIMVAESRPKLHDALRALDHLCALKIAAPQAVKEAEVRPRLIPDVQDAVPAVAAPGIPSPAPLTVLAYERTGMVRVSHEVEVGDQVDWKRHGARGSYRCYILNVWRSPSGRTMLLVKPFEHDGRRLGEEQITLTITGRNILAVYNMQGERKEPIRQ